MLSAEMGVGGSLQRAPSASKSVSLPGHVKRAAKNMNWMPIDWEKLYGQDLHQKRTDILNPANKAAARFYKQGNDMLKQVLAQISEPHPFEFKLYVSKETQANAEAFPGGYLYISKEALNRGAEYATFALAHEIGHVTKRHTTKEIQTRIVDSITTFDDLRKLMVARNASPATVLSYGRFLHGLFLNYSRDQETQADACAVHMMARIPGFDVRKATDAFLKALREDQHDGAGARGHVSTHPSYPERKQRIERLLAHYLNKASR
jgi:predicted Zn-dependent protease